MLSILWQTKLTGSSPRTQYWIATSSWDVSGVPLLPLLVTIYIKIKMQDQDYVCYAYFSMVFSPFCLFPLQTLIFNR